ncbi:hypothetical protein LCGC14_1465680, partial [marine sediment metagenome]
MRRVILCAVVVLSCSATTPTSADFLVSDFYAHKVLRYDETGVFLGDFISGGPLQSPSDMTLGPDGNVYVISQGNTSILRYQWPSGEFLGSFALGGNLGSMRDLTFGPDGNLHVVAHGGVKEYDGITGEYLGDLIPARPMFGDETIGLIDFGS